MNHRYVVGPLLLGVVAAFAACSGGEGINPADTGKGDDAAATSGAGAQGSGPTGTGGAGVGGGTPEVKEIATISGDITWQVSFDATAQAAGAKDCSYTRHYEGVEDLSAPWVCPSCEVVFHADVAVSAGLADCFSQVSADPPPAKEWIGYGKGVWYRGAALTTNQGTATVDAMGVKTANMVADLDVPVGGKMSFTITGDLTLGKEDGDPLHGFVSPATYACGWPKSDAPPYTGDYLVKKGATVPDGIFLDSCNEAVRLHDFKGSYMLIDMSARDCPPCQSWATDEEKFVSDMKAQGIDVHVVTLLAPSLEDPLGETTKAMIDGWISKFKLTSAVIADRAWGVAMFLPLFPDTLAYPSWVLVDPDLKVMDFGNGYGGFAPFQTAILADAK